MSSISHQQAIQWIHRRLDGLLDQEQGLVLDEHLRSCEECTAYASEMELLPLHLRHEFHVRWDKKPGPSHQVLKYVTSQARSVPATNRFSASLKLIASVVALLLLAVVLNYIIPTVRNTAASRATGTSIATPLRIDPQSCKAASELELTLQPPNELYGYKLIQGTSFVDGDFTYEFWLYCDPSLKPNATENLNTIAGLGISASWRYTGPKTEGPVEYYYEFEQGNPLGKSSSGGPLYQASASGTRFGIDLPEQTIQEHFQQGDPIQFRLIIDSPLGQNGSTLSFNLGLTERGFRIANLHASTLDHPNQGLIAFSSDQNGNYEIYTMRSDGSGLTNLTKNKANDQSPLWSPDGKKIAFASERTGNPDIFIMNLDGSDLKQLTDNPGYDGFFSWLPDSQKIVYLASPGTDPNYDGTQLMIMNSDGNNKVPLTKELGSYTFVGWSPHGQKIIYLKQKPDPNAKAIPDTSDYGIYAIGTSGLNRDELFKFADEILYEYRIYWQDDEHFLAVLFNRRDSSQPRWSLYKFSLDSTPPLELAFHSSPILGIFEHAHIVEGGTILAWYASDGSPTPLKSWNYFDICGNSGDRFIPQTSHVIAPNGKFALVLIPCRSGTTQFYFESEDGSEIKQLTNYSLDETEQVSGWNWSADGKYVILTIASRVGEKADLYLFDIDKMLKDLSTHPIRLTTDKAMKSEAVWQPMP